MKAVKLLLLPFLFCMFLILPSGCVSEKGSEGLKYMENVGGQSYSVQSIGSCTDTKVVVPAKYNGKPVTRIYTRAFAGTKITQIVLPEGIQYIHEKAFLECKNLTSVTIPNSVLEIGGSAFSACESLQTVKFGRGSLLEKIGGGAFASCTALTRFEVPSSVKTISSYAFQYCTALEEMSFLEGATYQNDAYAIWMGCTALKTTYLPGTFEKLGWAIFENCTSLETVFVGTADEYAMLDRYYNLNSNGPFWGAEVKRYCYSEEQPREEGYFWHYVKGEMTVWE